jgi:hypothetical protein
MSLLTQKGTLTTPAATGNQSYTGVGFQPTAVLFFATLQTASGFASDYCVGFGAATTSSARKSFSLKSTDNRTGSLLSGRAANTAIQLYSAAIKVDADLVTLDADGFTLNWTTADASNAYIIHYIALGGSSMTNALVSDFTPVTTAGAQAVTGVGFQPDCLLFFGSRLTVAAGLPATGFSDFSFALGATSGVAASIGMGGSEKSGANPVSEASFQVASAYATTTDTAAKYNMSLTSFDADGFTVNFAAGIETTAMRIFYVALKGGSYKAGVETQGTSTGTKATTGVGFKPSGLLLFGTNRAHATATDVTQMKMSIGATDGTNQGAVWWSATDNVATTDSNMANLSSVALRHASNTATTDAEAAISSMDSDGFTLNWTTADATAREFGYLAFGPAPSGVVSGSATGGVNFPTSLIIINL